MDDRDQRERQAGIARRSAGPTHRLLVPGLLFIGMVVAVISSLGAPLIPTIAAVDHVSLSNAQWTLTVTFLVSAMTTPLLGRLGDGPYRRPVILSALGIVVVGSALAALPFGFVWLLVGRGLHGVGLGLTPLAMAVARDALPAERSRSTVAMLSITTVAGVGLGYPLTGLIAEHGGLHAAFWFGAAVGMLALIIAILVVQSANHRPPIHIDIAGATLLGLAFAALLLALSEGVAWGWGSGRLITVTAVSLLALAAWVVLELKMKHPLVELRLLREPSVLTAAAVAVLAGVGMYLLMSLVTRLVQTPTSTGYGLGDSVAVAGLVLLPFSAGSVAASRVTPLLIRRASAAFALSLGSLVVLIGMVMFAAARGSLWEIAVVMGIAGLGVGCIFAALPGLIVNAVPAHETGSAMSFNQVLRYVGFAAGSTLSAVVLESRTSAGRTFPQGDGYTQAALIGCGIWIIAALASFILPRLGSRRVGAIGLDIQMDTPGHHLSTFTERRPTVDQQATEGEMTHE